MSNIDKQALRLAAKNATQGGWKFARSGFNAVVQAPVVLQRGGNALTVVCKLFRSEWRGELKTSQDAVYIAAANPVTVLALLDELEAKNKRIAELERKVHNGERQDVIDQLCAAGEPWEEVQEYMQKWDAERAAAAGKGE